MPLVNASAFAKLAGVSKVAVSKAVNASPPRLILMAGKLDTENPVNAMYLAASHQGAKGRAAPAPAPKKAKRANPDTELTAAVMKAQAKRQTRKVPDTEDDLSPDEKAEREKLAKTIADLMGDTADLDRQKKVQAIALQRAQELRHLLKFEQDKKSLVQIEAVRQIAATINASLSTNVFRSSPQVVPELFAMARAGATVQEGIAAHEKAMGLAVTRVLEDIDRAV